MFRRVHPESSREWISVAVIALAGLLLASWLLASGPVTAFGARQQAAANGPADRPKTPPPTRTPAPTKTSTPTRTLTPPRTATSTRTATRTPTAASSPVDTRTPQSTRTVTPTSTGTRIETATRTSTAQASVTATPTGVACQTTGALIGSIDASDPLLTGRLNRDGVTSACDVPKTCPTVLDSIQRHYDSYTVTNTTGHTACFTVNIDAGACTGAQYLFSAAYLGQFNPNDLCANYLADIGASPNPTGSYSFTLPAGAHAVVVVHEVDAGAGCGSYAITIGTCQCAISFSDVQPADYFYPAVQYLFCEGAISGYGDNTFRPYNNTTRAQLTKIMVNAERWTADTTGGPHFADVPPSNGFYSFVETAYNKGIISGYDCGGPGEPCPGLYFRPNADITRAQLSKIVVNAQGWTIDTAGGPHFTDVPPTNPFYGFIETAFNNGVISGYSCGLSCLEFRPGNNATRGQISKIVYNAVSAP